MTGWYATKRGTLDHPLFKPDGPFSKFEAWHWLIERAAFKPTPLDVHGDIITVPRGSLCVTLRHLAAEWSWTVKRVRTFLDRLEREGTIHRKLVGNQSDTSKGTSRTMLSLCNYDRYQATPSEKGTTEGTAGAQQGHIKEQDNTSVPYGTDAESVADLRTRIYATGKAALAKGGAKNPGALITKWLAKSSEADVMAAILASDGRNDRVAFIEGFLRRRAKPDRRNLSVVEDLDQRGFRDLENDQRAADRRGDNRSSPARQPADDVPRMLTAPAQEGGPVPVGDVRDGSHPVSLLALRSFGSAVA